MAASLTCSQCASDQFVRVTVNQVTHIESNGRITGGPQYATAWCEDCNSPVHMQDRDYRNSIQKVRSYQYAGRRAKK